LDGLASQLAPVRAEQKEADRKADQQEPNKAGDILHDRELDPPDDEPDGQRRERHTQQVVNAATNCSARATPPISAVSVIKLIMNEALRLSTATRSPRRSRISSNVARPLTAATRPAICAKTHIPITPTTTAQPSESPKREPTTALVTRSPISTKPPIAVRMPRATPKSSSLAAPQLAENGIHLLTGRFQVRGVVDGTLLL
jgi:hypothetical protein